MLETLLPVAKLSLRDRHGQVGDYITQVERIDFSNPETAAQAIKQIVGEFALSEDDDRLGLNAIVEYLTQEETDLWHLSFEKLYVGDYGYHHSLDRFIFILFATILYKYKDNQPVDTKVYNQAVLYFMELLHNQTTQPKGLLYQDIEYVIKDNNDFLLNCLARTIRERRDPLQNWFAEILLSVGQT